MSVIDDPLEQYCVDCSQTHAEHTMSCCNECEKWSCQPFTLDDFAEVCNACWPAYKAKQDEKASEQQMERDLQNATGGFKR